MRAPAVIVARTTLSRTRARRNHLRHLYLYPGTPYTTARQVRESKKPQRRSLRVAKNSPLAIRLADIRQRIGTAATQANREPSEVTLIAVTKTAAPEQIREILQLGVGDLGESRVQVITQKIAQVNEFYHRQKTRDEQTFAPKLRWHMIGHLQRNKVKPILPLVDLIHSVDSLRLAEEIEVASTKLDRRTPVLLQV